MKPKKRIKRHHLTEPQWILTSNELISRMNEISNTIHRNSRNSPANWVIVGSEAQRLLDEAMTDNSWFAVSGVSRGDSTDIDTFNELP
jgi:hypothetical protein